MLEVSVAHLSYFLNFLLCCVCTFRIRRWFILGVSLGRVLELVDGATLVRALSQLLEEYEYYIAHEVTNNVYHKLRCAFILNLYAYTKRYSFHYYGYLL